MNSPSQMASQSVFGNSLLVNKILKNMLSNDDSSLELCKYRTVSTVFNFEVLAIIRQDHREVVVCPALPEVADGDHEFTVNERRLKVSTSATCFHFLNHVAQISIRRLEFDGFREQRPALQDAVHDAVMNDLLGTVPHKIVEYLGAGDICMYGCQMCYSIARKCTIYGPMQHEVPYYWRTHYKHLIIDEYMLYTIAHQIATQGRGKAAFFKVSDLLVPDSMTCDHMVIRLSDTPYGSSTAARYPRQLIHYMVTMWEVKRVTLKFITNFTQAIDESLWSIAPRKFVPMSFVQEPDTVEPFKRPFERVNVDLSNARSFGDDFMACVKDERPERGFAKLVSVVRRVFPTTQLYVYMPSHLSKEPLGSSENFHKTLYRFTWNQDEKSYWRTELFFRFHVEDERAQVVNGEDFNGLNAISIRATDNAANEKFEKWPIVDYLSEQTSTSFLFSGRCSTTHQSSTLTSSRHVLVDGITIGLWEDPSELFGDYKERQPQMMSIEISNNTFEVLLEECGSDECRSRQGIVMTPSRLLLHDSFIPSVLVLEMNEDLPDTPICLEDRQLKKDDTAFPDKYMRLRIDVEDGEMTISPESLFSSSEVIVRKDGNRYLLAANSPLIPSESRNDTLSSHFISIFPLRHEICALTGVCPPFACPLKFAKIGEQEDEERSTACEFLDPVNQQSISPNDPSIVGDAPPIHAAKKYQPAPEI